MKDECDSEVFNQGEFVAFDTGTKAEVEAKCKKLTAESDYIYDWHYAMGRAVIKRLKKGFVKEQRYILIKQKDMDAAELTNEERQALGDILAKIAKKRHNLGKAPLEAVVIESDWKCYDEAWKLVRGEWESNQ